MKLRKAEAARLHAVVIDPEQPVRMGKSRYLASKETDDAAYRRLSEMSQTIFTAFSLCLLDNECINIRTCKALANRGRLRKYVEQALVASRAVKEFSSEDEEDQWLEAIFLLVDYISAVIARLVSQMATGPFWIENVLAVLVARVAKMKFLLCDIVASASRAVLSGDEALEASKQDQDASADLEDADDECEEALRILDASRKDGLTSDEEAEVVSFCINQNKFRSGLNTAFRYILQSLRLMNLSGLPSTTYEMCLVAYKIGFEDFKTVLYQDRDLEYSASSDLDILNTTQVAMVILDQALGELQETNNRPVGPEDKTIVEWKYCEDADIQPASDQAQFQPKSMPLYTLADVVTAMVPLVVTSPIFLSSFTNFRTMMALTGNAQEVVQTSQGTQFSAFCRLYTREFDKEAESRKVMRLSEAFRNGRFSFCQLVLDEKASGRLWPMLCGSSPGRGRAVANKDVADEAKKALDRCCQKMDRWVVDRTSVTVPSRRYVSTVMLIAMVLCGGGLGLGFTVGERISGVDPFDLASYNWVLAAFFILACKAVRVESWAWSDFLRWRVRCRSVSELAATTSVDDQVIIARLLHDDCGDGILQTSGPFNSVFRRQTGEGQGFSIDRPIHLATLTLSGLTLLKVVTPRGNAVVCLDHRRGTDLATVLHQGGQDKQRLVCDDVSQRIKDNGGTMHWKDWLGPRQTKLHLTKAEHFKWKRVQGLYDFEKEDVVFM